MLVRRAVLERPRPRPPAPGASATTSTSAGARPAPATGAGVARGGRLPRRGGAPRRPPTPLTGAFRRAASGRRPSAPCWSTGRHAGCRSGAVRLLLGSLVRALGLLLVRAPGEAADELAGAGLGLPATRPGAWPDGASAGPPRPSAHRRGPAPAGARLAALPARPGRRRRPARPRSAHQAGDLSEARHARRPDAPTAAGRARLVTSPVAWVFAVLVLAALVAARGLVGGGSLSGGALLPAPDSALDWWRVYLAGHHDVGGGSTAPAAPYLLPLAVAGTVLLGQRLAARRRAAAARGAAGGVGRLPVPAPRDRRRARRACGAGRRTACCPC